MLGIWAPLRLSVGVSLYEYSITYNAVLVKSFTQLPSKRTALER